MTTTTNKGWLVENANGELWTGEEWANPHHTTGVYDAATFDSESAAVREQKRVGGTVRQRD